MCQFSTTTWSGFDCAIDRQNYREIVTKICSYRCYAFEMDNLSQTDVILSKCRFIPHNFRRALRAQRFAAGTNIICLAYATDWWAVIGPVIYGESKSQATRTQTAPYTPGVWLGPCGSTLLASCQVLVCPLFVCNWRAKFKQNVIVLCICRRYGCDHDVKSRVVKWIRRRYPLSNSDSKNLFRAGGLITLPRSARRVFLVPF